MNVLKALMIAFVLALSACTPATADAARDASPLGRAHAATVRLDFANGVCSGTVIGPRAILTATHCFRGVTAMTVNGNAVNIAKRIDDGNDHSIVWVDRKFSSIARIAKRDVEQGDRVRIWGNPAGLRDVLRTGQMVGVDREGPTPLILFDINAFQGDSGSGIFNDRGEIVGVLSGIMNLAENRTYAKVAVALPLAFEEADVARATGRK